MLNQITSFFLQKLAIIALLNPLKKTKNAWSLIFFNQVLPTSELLFKAFQLLELAWVVLN